MRLSHNSPASKQDQEHTVLFVAGDPGGAAALLPVIQAWQGPKTVFTYRQATKLFESDGVLCQQLSEESASEAQAADIITSVAPSAIFTSTSVNGIDWERHFFNASRRLNVPSGAVLDYWSNYSPRFTQHTPLDALPDAVAIMDERARTEMIAEGFPASQLVITGQPVLDIARSWRQRIKPEDIKRFRARLNLADDTLAFLFVSQPLQEMRRLVGAPATSGQDEFVCLRKLIAAAEAHPSSSKAVLLKMHPREDKDKYDALLSSGGCSVRVVDAAIHSWEACMAANVVYGMSSMLLEEAQVLGVPVERIRDDHDLHLASHLTAPRAPLEANSALATQQILVLLAALCERKHPLA